MELEAAVPHGVAPGEVFMAQTPAGLVPVQVPVGGQPGQKIRFSMPSHSNSTAPAPVLLGTAVPYQTPQARPVQLQQNPSQGYTYTPGYVYRVDPFSARPDNVPLLQGIPVEKADRKVYEIHKGAELARDMVPFPTRRRWRDTFWVLPFLVILGGMTVACVYYAQRLESEFKRRAEPASGGHSLKLLDLILPGIAGGVASLVAAAGYVLICRWAPGCVVWTSLIFSPVLTIMAGLALLSTGSSILGAIVIALGAIFLTAVFWCWRHLIPFMIALVRVIANVIKEHPMMVSVSLLGSLLGIGWALVCGIVFVGAFEQFQDNLENASGGERWGIMFVAVLIFIWGAQVFQNVCHVTYCGVFGRWYFKAETHAPLRRSLTVALTTSFGSICFGSLLIAAVRALEAMIRMARRDAMEEGNTVCCIILCVLEGIVSCIGDILEYFSEWAYVQCAVRGASFIEGARITYSMLTCANLQYVLSDLLVNSVVNLGSLLCGVVGAAAGALTGLGFGSSTPVVSGGVIGLFAGLMAGGAAAGIISSGTKTILALWAENPEPLRHTHPEIHGEFERKICGQLYGTQ